MLQALRRNPQRQRVSRGVSLPAPVEGWDTSSPLAEMSPKRAIKLDNWFPQAEYVEVRRGHKLHRPTAVDDPVETLVVYNGSISSKLFAFAGGDIYDVSASDTHAQTAEVGISGLANSRIQYVNFTTTGGHFAWCCNGADDPFTYNGTTWAATPAITGISPGDIVNVNAHKGRLWFVLSDSTKAAYLNVDSIGGAATEFELGGLMSHGGYLVAMGTWSRDAGDGPDDYAVFVTSRGQIIVYAGTDPNVPALWQLIGVFNLGAPLGRRCFRKVGSDLAVVTIDGVYPLSNAISFDRGAVERVAITGRIQRAMNDAARQAQNSFGWELISYPKGTMAILNVPLVENVTQQQFVMNTLTGAWCRFTNQNANTFAVFNDRLFFGGNDGSVYEADVAGSDYLSNFTALMKTSFQYYGQRGVKKRWTMIQPLITTDGAVVPSIGLDTDFRDGGALSLATTVPVSSSLWNQMIWNLDPWGQQENTLIDWLSVSGLGQNAAINLRVDIQGEQSASLWDVALFDEAVFEPEATNPITLQVNGFNLTVESGEYL